MLISGTEACRNSNDDGYSTVRATFTVFRRDATIIFETEPEQALPDVWYENNKSFPSWDRNY